MRELRVMQVDKLRMKDRISARSSASRHEVTTRSEALVHLVASAPAARGRARAHVRAGFALIAHAQDLS